MMTIFKPVMLAFVFLASGWGNADDFVIDFGVEPIKKNYSYSDVMTLRLGYVQEVKPNVLWKVDFGYWKDDRKGGANSFYGGPSIGLQVEPWIFLVQVFAGVNYITQRDEYLGGNWQFKEDLFLGLQEGNGSIGLTFTHLSSAGIYKPNIGKNFVQLTAKYRP